MKLITLQSKDGEKIGGTYAFHDLNASIAHKFSERDRISLKFYYGLDRLRLSRSTPDTFDYATVDGSGTDEHEKLGRAIRRSRGPRRGQG